MRIHVKNIYREVAQLPKTLESGNRSVIKPGINTKNSKGKRNERCQKKNVT